MKRISLFITCSLLFSHQQASSAEGLFGKAFEITVDAAKSDFAFQLYTAFAVTAAGFTAKTLMEPALAKYRQVTNTENFNELHAKATLKEKLLELDQTDFQVQMAKIQMLADYLPKYQEIMQKRMEAIKASAASEEEKQTLLAQVESRLKQTQENLEEGNAQGFERLAASTSAQFKAHMIQRAKNR